MCRIAGLVSPGPDVDNRRRVVCMIDVMSRGGPDDQGIFESGGVTLGHRRLSIIDLSAAGHQPMVIARSRSVITYNGEVYNFRELKSLLEREGHSFDSQSDTEVIIRAYDAWGVHSFDRLSGMFAFALFDPVKNKTYLVRDSGGIKPMYYGKSDGSIAFASEIRAFKKLRPDWPESGNWQKLFLSFGFIPHPFTTLEGVRSLAPGHYLELDETGQIGEERAFHKPPMPSSQKGIGLELQARVRGTVEAAVRRHLISDAPLGVFLSGGIDSSLLALLASREVGSKLVTVSVNFQEGTYDERPYQDLVLKRIPSHVHRSLTVSENHLWESWSDIWQAMDQPTIDGVNSYFVSRAAHECGLKAVLSGLGADELFGGYGSFQRIGMMNTIRPLPWKKSIGSALGGKYDRLRRVSFLSIPGPVGDYLFLRGLHTPDQVAAILQCDESEVWKVLTDLQLPASKGLSDVDYASFLETGVYMRSQLLKDTDFMSMWFGLEVRVPFLDKDLVELVRSHGLTDFYDSRYPKSLLTRPFADTLPQEIVDRKKHGFVFPFHAWLASGIRTGRNIIPGLQTGAPWVKDFLAGRQHWSKCWSVAVLHHFGRSQAA